MSRFKTSEALMEQLLNNLPTGVVDADVARKNQNPPFEPKGKEIWLDANAIEATSETNGKGFDDSDSQRGFFQIDIRVPATSYLNDSQLSFTVDELASAFRFGTSLVYNGQTVSIQDSTSPQSQPDGEWYRRMITINYLTISTRV